MKISTLLNTWRDRLTKISEKEPLSIFSLFLVILFDIFIFSLITDGLSEVTRSVKSPESYAGFHCRELLDTDTIKREEDRRVGVIQRLRSSSEYSYGRSSYDYTMVEKPSGLFEYGDGCEEIRAKIASIYEYENGNSEFQKKIDELATVEKLLAKNETEQAALKSQYDTKLLEKAVNQPSNQTMDPGDATTIANTVNNLRESSGALRARFQSIVDSVYALPKVQDLVKTMESSAYTIRTTYASLVFWYPVKTFGMELLFLLPLFLLVLIWIRISIVKNREVQSLVWSHLMAVIALFGLGKLIEFIYDILPKKLIQNIINFLISWNVIEIWYYFLIALSILGCLAVIYIVQKKILNPRKQESKRVAHGLCLRCGAHRIPGEEFCVACGTAVFTKCATCGEKTLAGGECCTKCGAKQK